MGTRDNVEWEAAKREVQGIIAREVQRRLPANPDAGDIERATLCVAREICGPVVGEQLTAQAAALATSGHCGLCGRRVRMVDRCRERHLTGVLGESTYSRRYFYCDQCKQGYVPADQVLGIGPSAWLPSLERASARLGIETCYQRAARALAEAVDLPIPEEDVRHTTEAIGTVAEGEHQARVAKTLEHRETPGPAESDTLIIAVDGCMVHVDGDWHEAKVGACAPYGPAEEIDPDTGRSRPALGRQRFVVGLEDAESFWYRLYAQATHQGLGGREVRRVAVLGDGADWIWNRAAPFLALPGVALTEIVDIWHARQYLWQVAHAVFGDGPQAARWAQPLSAALQDAGARPIITALQRLQPTSADGRERVRLGLEYFGKHAQRMRYPDFAAAGLPIGSGIVESACKLVVKARQAGAGMRWGWIGSQAVATLRAVHRSGDRDRFWLRCPQLRRPPIRTLRNRVA